MKLLDFWVLVGALVLAGGLFLCFWWGEQRGLEPISVEIYYLGELYQEVPLDFEQEIVINNNVLEIKNGQALMVAADCPDKTCLKMGAISQRGQIICCLPNQILIKLSGNKEGELDAITR